MMRPEDIKARIGNIDQIEAVVGAMRALAAAHEHEATRHLEAIREQAATVADAMARALSLLPGPPPSATAAQGDRPGRHLRIVVGAAQGFSGYYNEQIVTAATDSTTGDPPDDYILIGVRSMSDLRNRGITPVWSANMAAHAAEVPRLATHVADAAFARLATGDTTRVSIVHGVPAHGSHWLKESALMPMDFSRIGPRHASEAPLITLPPAILVARLVEEYVYTEICEALMLGFAAENDARLRAMSRARTNVARIARDLRTQFTQAMQEQTTTEILELSQNAP